MELTTPSHRNCLELRTKREIYTAALLHFDSLILNLLEIYVFRIMGMRLYYSFGERVC